MSSPITAMAAIANVMDVRKAVAITKACVLGSRLMAAGCREAAGARSLWRRRGVPSIPEGRVSGLCYVHGVRLRQLVCPHCKKRFAAEPIGDGSGNRRGFKCPHCHLFVPSDRANGGEGAAAQS